MIDSLNYSLTPNMQAIGSKNDGTTFIFDTGEYYASNSDHIMNWNTLSYNGVQYYTWYAATAGIAQPEDYDKTIDGSVCPAGWRIPPYDDASIGGQFEKSFDAFMSAYGIIYNSSSYTNVEAFPISFSRNGRTINGALPSPTWGGAAYYWTATVGAASDEVPVHLFYYDYRFILKDRQYKVRGCNIRCEAL